MRGCSATFRYLGFRASWMYSLYPSTPCHSGTIRCEEDPGSPLWKGGRGWVTHLLLALSLLAAADGGGVLQDGPTVHVRPDSCQRGGWARETGSSPVLQEGGGGAGGVRARIPAKKTYTGVCSCTGIRSCLLCELHRGRGRIQPATSSVLDDAEGRGEGHHQHRAGGHHGVKQQDSHGDGRNDRGVSSRQFSALTRQTQQWEEEGSCRRIGFCPACSLCVLPPALSSHSCIRSTVPPPPPPPPPH